MPLWSFFLLAVVWAVVLAGISAVNPPFLPFAFIVAAISLGAHWQSLPDTH